MDQIIQYSQHRAQSKRTIALDYYYRLDPEEKIDALLLFLQSEYLDLSSFALSKAVDIEVTSNEKWRNALFSMLNDADKTLAQRILFAIGELDSEILAQHRDLFEKYSEDPDADIRYQAFACREKSLDISDAYMAYLEKVIKDDDEDMRIVATQAFERIGGERALKNLEEAFHYASRNEMIHNTLAMAKLKAPNMVQRLTALLLDDRSVYAATIALREYGDAEAIPELLRVAKAFLAEPSVKVSAAWSAAALGSEEGTELLKKFALAKKGNPDLAKEALEALGVAYDR